ncbi:MAG: hypothetical protein ACTS27_07375 [Phycisphaerales bacterium]
MGFSFNRQRSIRERGEIMRRHTSVWLTWAMMQHDDSLPKIPVRRVDRGGWKFLRNNPLGRWVAWHWWERAFERIPLGRR